MDTATRIGLAAVARREAELELVGEGDLCGPAIERYLAVLRDAFNRNAGTTHYSDPRIGFPWCGAFVYYCCLKAGFIFPPKPDPDYRFTIGAVSTWQHWAIKQGFFIPAGAGVPEIGDIALYNHVYDGNPLDHVGIVVEVWSDSLLSAEGNCNNRTGLFLRPLAALAGLVRLPETMPPCEEGNIPTVPRG